jgi:hypothetical protein
MNIDLSKLRRLIRKGSKGTNSMNQLVSNTEDVTAPLTSNRPIDVNTERRKGEIVVIVTDILTELDVFYRSI